MFTTLENIPLVTDLTQQALTTGWTFSGNHALHEVCNAGIMYLLNYPLISGQTYVYSYEINSISGGYVQASLGTSSGSVNTTSGLKTETVTATGANPILSFYSNANCDIDILTLQQQVVIPTDTKQYNTIVYNDKLDKWTSFYSFNPDMGFAIFTNLFTFKSGQLYLHESGSDFRCSFYGVQYQAILNFVSTISPAIPKSFISLSIQSNVILVTTEDGITNPLNQISELAEIDFIKDFLDDGVSQVSVNNKESVYSANFLRDKNDDLINGTPLKGNYINIELQTLSTDPLRLFTVEIVSNHSAIGSR